LSFIINAEDMISVYILVYKFTTLSEFSLGSRRKMREGNTWGSEYS